MRECRGPQALCAESRGGRWGPRRNPAQRFRWGEEEQQSERAFAVGGSEGYGACDDAMMDPSRSPSTRIDTRKKRPQKKLPCNRPAKPRQREWEMKEGFEEGGGV